MVLYPWRAFRADTAPLTSTRIFLQNNIDTNTPYRCSALDAEVPGHWQEHLTQILMVRLLKTPCFCCSKNWKYPGPLAPHPCVKIPIDDQGHIFLFLCSSLYCKRSPRSGHFRFPFCKKSLICLEGKSPSSGKHYYLPFLPATPSWTLEGFFELTRRPSKALNLDA